MKKNKKWLSYLLTGTMLLSCAAPAYAAEDTKTAEMTETVETAENVGNADGAESTKAADEDITILYTNDVHTYIDNAVSDETALTYSKIAALKDSFEDALLVDAGDHIQGTAYGQMDDGMTIIKLMNAADYDAATLGNHEFDYGMDGCMAAMETAEFPYTSSNFYDKTTGKPVADTYTMLEAGGKQIAFVGITTPKTFTSSTPTYFQDKNGTFIYDFHGEDLYAVVQTAIDEAEEAGADYVIGLGHLGTDLSDTPWTSTEVIKNTDGFDAFIDGHSHTELEMETVTDKSGDAVILTQTGSYLNAVGKMTLSVDGITAELLTGEDLTDLIPDAEVKAQEDAWISEIEARLGEVIGFAEVTLDNYDENGNRLVRKQETNSGDFVADSLYYLFEEMGMDVDVAIMNGGGTRNAAVTGELSYRTCKEVHPFGNVACLQTVTGQQLLDALEWGASKAQPDGSVENGGFLQVSGLRYTIDLTVPSTVQKDENNLWTGSPTGEYRVKDVLVLNNQTGEYEPLALDAEYNLAGYNYTLRNLGDGFNMFAGSVNVLDYVAEDYMVLANYIQSFPTDETTGLPTITAEDGYADVNGNGRITLLTEPAELPETPETPEISETSAELPFADIATDSWCRPAVTFVYENGLMSGTSKDTFSPQGTTSRAMLVSILWRTEGKPEAQKEAGFADVPADKYYTEAVAWAAENGVVSGYNEKTFAPNDSITREQLASILYRYAKLKGYDVSTGEDNILSYDDAAKISEYAIPALQWTCGNGIVNGYAGKLDPAGSAQRAHTAQMLMKFMESTAK